MTQAGAGKGDPPGGGGHASLFQGFRLKGLALRNRIVMAPMTRFFAPGGVVTKEVAQYYGRRAAADVGLIISEGVGVDRPASLNHPNAPRFEGRMEQAAWKRVIEEVHAAGGVMAPQLWHVGAVGGSRRGAVGDWTPAAAFESPSGLAAADRAMGGAMSEEDVADAIQAFASGAASAQRLGFDAVELHGAHGYLIDQFFWDVTNRREDAYGGVALAGRARFAADILREVRAAVGPEFPIIIRLSQWKQQDYGVKLAAAPRELEQWLAPLVDAGADVIHCSQRRFWEPEFDGSDLNFAGWTKKLTGLPTITVGSVGLTGEFIAAYAGEASQPASLDELMRRLDRGDFDLVAVGRALLQDPDWVRKVRDGRSEELMPFRREAMEILH
jgi:2,4-dienoyl-CoA reductase-like NADH-dependent reductase (Old Yellow Enzyme family)